MASRDNFTQKTKDLLARRTGFVCSNPSCRAMTVGPSSDSMKAINIGVAAHITAAAKGGPRYKNTLSEAARISPQNGIWLCASCATLVDRDESRYTEWDLIAWKDQAETDALRSLESGARWQAGDDPYDQEQSRSYTEAFESLIRLRQVADELWHNPRALTPETLLAFAQQRNETENTITQRAIFFEPNDFQLLQFAFEAFWRFEIGKRHLGELLGEFAPEARGTIDDATVRSQVEVNRHWKTRYDELVTTSREKFVAHLRRGRR